MDTKFQYKNSNRSGKSNSSKSSKISLSSSVGIGLSPVAIKPNTLPDLGHKLSWQSSAPLSVAEAVVEMLTQMGVKYAFGVSGGAIANLWHTLQQSSIEVLHFRHESGAAFAACEAYFASSHPVVVFTTTGPGITNALTGLFAARWEGAKVILLSGFTSAPQRGRWACQETSPYTMSNTGIFSSGALFNYATTIECSSQLPEVSRRLALGTTRPDGFVAHLSIPTAIQSSLVKASLPRVNLSHSLATASEETIAQCAKLLSERSFAIWVGFGARKAAAAIRQLAEKTGAAVMCSPRGKGIFPENHPQFVGVTGFAGHESVFKYMQEKKPWHTLVLGTRLGEPTSFWNPMMVPSGGFLHVDIDPDVPGTAYPEAETFAIQSDVGEFVKALLKYFPQLPNQSNQLPEMRLPRPKRHIINPSAEGSVRPEVLMHVIQRVIVDNSNVVVMAEAGNSFAWVINQLQFTKPERYRVSTGLGSMGHFATGVVGAALGHDDKAVAIVGDGSMLMNNEISTAVRYQIPAVWIVLNDGRYNMCEKGQAMQGFQDTDAEIPQTDFARIAHCMGAEGVSVTRESDLQQVLEKAIASTSPLVVDVLIDPTPSAPMGNRIQSLKLQCTTSTSST
ncbi:MAG: thiamine pyrophosphate-binding protein [Symploca sp. SIO3C6]|uniref:Thiamine pyrophosphate-binding protein n=1 Tax=Symploca sp. SIO1C4 TaxID=2607765 RepID=A0A6B3N704_9CYAN|nr:thiamine pyrophosphate-binding protein [Symploca sp. SIO3C6]NER28889.1 thiamine pyrophosphate-binding protein [Symploca sp. SIO1C4]